MSRIANLARKLRKTEKQGTGILVGHHCHHFLHRCVYPSLASESACKCTCNQSVKGTDRTETTINVLACSFID